MSTTYQYSNNSMWTHVQILKLCSQPTQLTLFSFPIFSQPSVHARNERKNYNLKFINYISIYGKKRNRTIYDL